MREIKSLTAIRGVAALWVITHHLTLFLRYPDLGRISKMLFMGFTGVDVFFVLSGFILTTVYLNLKLSGVGEFALRRVMRIYPLNLAVLAFMAVMAYFSIIWPYSSADWHTLPEVALLLHPYLSLDHGFWNGVTWSAGVEFSCYLLFPWALFLLRRLPLYALVPLVALAGYWEWHVQIYYHGTWFGLPCVERGLGGFALGMSLGLVSPRLALPRWLVITGELASVTVWGLAVATFTIPLVPLAAAGLIWMLGQDAGPISRLLSTPLPLYLGKISFSLYMVHLPLVTVYGYFWPIYGHPPLTLLFALREAGFFAVLIAVASLTYFGIERPAQRLFRGKRRLASAPAPHVAMTNAS